MYDISDAQDAYWESDMTGTGGALSQAFALGFAADDPVGDMANSLEPTARDALVGTLQVLGYPVAAIPFETGNPDLVKAWLVTAARMFDAMIGRNLAGPAFEGALAPLIHRDVQLSNDDLDDWLWAVCDWWVDQRQGHCIPQTTYGEWQPDGDACDCNTEGPWSAGCGHFKADANGKIKTWVPWPPPRGTTIEITVGVGVEIDLCVCVWQRTCVAEATKRTVTQVTRDCRKVVTTEYGGQMTFTSHEWTTAYPADQCQLAGTPPHMPPDDQPCGLSNQ